MLHTNHQIWEKELKAKLDMKSSVIMDIRLKYNPINYSPQGEHQFDFVEKMSRYFSNDRISIATRRF